MQPADFEPYLTRWRLTVDGTPIASSNSRLIPVRYASRPAMLKIATKPEEKSGGRLMAWWAGVGAAQVYEEDSQGVLLLERAMTGRTLSDLALAHKGVEASRHLCSVAARLHAPRAAPVPRLITLRQRFQALLIHGQALGGFFEKAARIAAELLYSPRDCCVLHGDLHHGNLLDFGERGWLAIDPKGLSGERTFDFASLFCNPELLFALRKNQFLESLNTVTACARLERDRLLRWIVAYSGLSAIWFIEDGNADRIDFSMAAMALEALAKSNR